MKTWIIIGIFLLTAGVSSVFSGFLGVRLKNSMDERDLLEGEKAEEEDWDDGEGQPE